jgi:branched-chain amino acid transport system permease protein
MPMAVWLLAQLGLNGIVTGSLYAVLAISFALIFAPTRTFHFAHGNVYVFAAYFLYQFAVVWGWPWVLAIPATLASAAVLGVLVDRVVYTPLLRSGAGVMQILLSAFGTFIVLQNVLLLVWKSDPRTIRIPDALKNGIPFGLLTVTPLDLLTVGVAAVVLGGVVWFIRGTRMGRAMRALENDPGVALMIGIPTERVRIVAFALGSALVAVAAMLTALDKGIEPTIGVNALLVAVVAMIVGGVGSYVGAALAGFSLGIIENLGIWQIPSEWRSTITFTVLAVFILFRPTGILGQRGARYSE